MKNIILVLLVAILMSSFGCSKSSDPTPGPGLIVPPPKTPPVKRRPASIGIVGDSANITKTVTGGMVLMGGGADVDEAFKWMINRSGGGDVVILRATGTDAYNSYVNALGTVNSVETLLINSRELANNDTVANIIRNAEMVFIAGGDQSDYMNYWKGTKTDAALNYLLTTKKAPVGGTSAGCAILGGMYYSGENGSIESVDALLNPFNSRITLYKNDFLQAPFLQNVITDQHFVTRNRDGRSMVFLGRILKDWNIAAKGIAVDERTAVCIDATGMAKVYGQFSTKVPSYNSAYFLATDATKQPEQFTSGNKVTWNNGEKAVGVYEIVAADNGGGSFNVATFKLSDATGGSAYWWYIENGVLNKKSQ